MFTAISCFIVQPGVCQIAQGVQYEEMQGFNENAHSKALAPL